MKTFVAQEENVVQVWDEYIVSRDSGLRERLVLHYLPLVKYIAGRMKIGMPGSVEYDDLVSTGVMGLVGCIDNFSPERGFKFETYAVPRIRGAILDGLRDEDWLPRSYRQKSRQLESAVSKLMVENGRTPDDYEVADELGLDADEYARFMEHAGAATLVSLDVPMSTGEEGETGSLYEVIPDEDMESPLEKLEEQSQREMVIKLIEGLNEQERAVVSLYYYEDLTFREIGEVLGVSESRVCQIHTRLIATLRIKIAEMTKG